LRTLAQHTKLVESVGVQATPTFISRTAVLHGQPSLENLRSLAQDP
jgi:protein-disulfide isomerase